jgi:hypothetical protein
MSLEDDAVAGIRLFEDSDNDLIISDSGSGDNYTEHVQNTKYRCIPPFRVV